MRATRKFEKIGILAIVVAVVLTGVHVMVVTATPGEAADITGLPGGSAPCGCWYS